jgi:hypothetical protein
MLNEYDVGDAVRFSANFKNSAGADADPTTVVFKIKDPSGTIGSYTYSGTGTNTILEKDSIGDYHLDFTLDESGVWHYRWYGTGILDVAEEAQIKVRESAFV